MYLILFDIYLFMCVHPSCYVSTVRDATKVGQQAQGIKITNGGHIQQRGGVGGSGGILPRTKSSVVQAQRSTLRAGGAARERKARRKNVARKARDQEEIRIFRGKASAIIHTCHRKRRTS